mmetsp:Transcript_103197/g.296158  ORF Transcript_103197/g.296158 Transcript_103197/m.296158 type:complete len:432 (+) Transcript_103197:5852-7147(+)
MLVLNVDLVVEVVVLADLAGREKLGLVRVAVLHVEALTLGVGAVREAVVLSRLPPGVAEEDGVLGLVHVQEARVRGLARERHPVLAGLVVGVGERVREVLAGVRLEHRLVLLLVEPLRVSGVLDAAGDAGLAEGHDLAVLDGERHDRVAVVKDGLAVGRVKVVAVPRDDVNVVVARVARVERLVVEEGRLGRRVGVDEVVHVLGVAEVLNSVLPRRLELRAARRLGAPPEPEAAHLVKEAEDNRHLHAVDLEVLGEGGDVVKPLQPLIVGRAARHDGGDRVVVRVVRVRVVGRVLGLPVKVDHTTVLEHPLRVLRERLAIELVEEVESEHGRPVTSAGVHVRARVLAVILRVSPRLRVPVRHLVAKHDATLERHVLERLVEGLSHRVGVRVNKESLRGRRAKQHRGLHDESMSRRVDECARGGGVECDAVR